MNAEKFTPGPWGHHNGIIALINENNIREKRIATVDLRLGVNERDANARLIAAAPDMLAVLREAADFVQPFNRASDFLDRIDAAIAKATGEASS